MRAWKQGAAGQGAARARVVQAVAARDARTAVEALAERTELLELLEMIELLDSAGVAAALVARDGLPIAATARYLEMASSEGARRFVEAASAAAAERAARAMASAAGREFHLFGPERLDDAWRMPTGERWRASVSTLHDAAAGVLAAVVLHREADAAPSDVELQARFGLSARELEVARLMAEGWTTPRIAGALGISPHTVRRHGERTFMKLGVRSRHDVRTVLRGGTPTLVSNSR